MKLTIAILVGLILAGGETYYGSTIHADAAGLIATQAASITQLTVEKAALVADKAALSDRLDTCIATAARYKSYTAENVKTMQGISDKWGANYNVPIKGVFASLAAAADQLICS